MGSTVTRYLLAALLAMACHRAAPPPTHALPAGQEALFAAMLGGRETLPGPCALDRARVEAQRVVAVYRCAQGEITIALHHPDDAPDGAVRAGALAVFAPEHGALFDAVVERVRQRGGAVRWSVVAARYAPDDARRGELSVRWLCAAALAVGVALAARRRTP